MKKAIGNIGKLGTFGAVIAALGCSACFPALGALGALIGLGFLAAYEGVLINTALPLMAVIVLLASIVQWASHRRTERGLISMLGPLLVLAALYPLWQYAWSGYVLYLGLTTMVVVVIFDVVRPAGKASCKT